mmetsp:Transcript_8714/g.15717  ORF Transcript_8714/g.15717 Transcript_8714/m.15717 type:complete len:205 (-) Transcript_8714:813-1427(-)
MVGWRHCPPRRWRQTAVQIRRRLQTFPPTRYDRPLSFRARWYRFRCCWGRGRTVLRPENIFHCCCCYHGYDGKCTSHYHHSPHIASFPLPLDRRWLLVGGSSVPWACSAPLQCSHCYRPYSRSHCWDTSSTVEGLPRCSPRTLPTKSPRHAAWASSRPASLCETMETTVSEDAAEACCNRRYIPYADSGGWGVRYRSSRILQSC